MSESLVTTDATASAASEPSERGSNYATEHLPVDATVKLGQYAEDTRDQIQVALPQHQRDKWAQEELKSHWQDARLCAYFNPNMWFPERGANPRVIAVAKLVCDACFVKDDCARFALRTGERFGTWGGMTEGERRKLRRQQA